MNKSDNAVYGFVNENEKLVEWSRFGSSGYQFVDELATGFVSSVVLSFVFSISSF